MNAVKIENVDQFGVLYVIPFILLSYWRFVFASFVIFQFLRLVLDWSIKKKLHVFILYQLAATSNSINLHWFEILAFLWSMVQHTTALS